MGQIMIEIAALLLISVPLHGAFYLGVRAERKKMAAIYNLSIARLVRTSRRGHN